jgi:SpoVK/Ycf46/Vps4 family AAA+-type ATPase
MASGKLLRQLIKSGVEGDARAFKLFSEEVIREEREKQHHLLASDLEQILYGGSTPVVEGSRHLSTPIPSDKERGLPLVTVRQPARTLDHIILTAPNRAAIESLLLEHRRSDLLRGFGLKPIDRLLLIGPPGCGKTLAAEVIASELSRYVAVIRIDSVVSSYLGETAANLRKLFDFIAGDPLVALFDEFDALGKERGIGDEHGELKRVVNAVLQMLDDYRGRSMIIAATNHEVMLDSAIWRRFDDVLEFDPPTADQVSAFLQLKLRAVRREFDIAETDVARIFTDYSFAGIERVVRQAVKTMVLGGRDFLGFDDLVVAQQRDRFRSYK